MGVPRGLQREVARPAGVNRYDLVAPADRSCRIGRQDSSFCGDRAPRAGTRPVAARRLRYAIVWPVRPLLRNSSLQRSGPPQLSSRGDARRGGIPIALHRRVHDDAAVPVIGRPFAAADADRGGTATHCPYCALQCGMRLGPALSVTGDPGFPVNKGQLCIKGFTAAGALGHRERLTTPLVRGASGELEPATWEEALGRVAFNLQRTRAHFGAGAVGVFGSGALTNEKTYLLGKFARVALGTANIDYNGRSCMCWCASDSSTPPSSRSRQKASRRSGPAWPATGRTWSSASPACPRRSSSRRRGCWGARAARWCSPAAGPSSR